MFISFKYVLFFSIIFHIKTSYRIIIYVAYSFISLQAKLVNLLGCLKACLSNNTNKFLALLCYTEHFFCKLTFFIRNVINLCFIKL